MRRIFVFGAKRKMISVFGSFIDELEIKYANECMASQWIGMGSKVLKFEKAFSEKFSVPNFLMVDSGTNALYLAIASLDIPPNSNIAVPSFTWVGCAQAVILAGHNPVFVDVDLDTMNVTKETIEKCTEKLGAIMVVHYAGLPVDIDPIINMGYPVIEDAAHAVCSKYKGKHCGTIGDVGIYSFDAVKNITAASGGGICFKDTKAKEYAKKLRYCGIEKSGFELAEENSKKIWWEYDIGRAFIKMLPTDINASIAIAQLEKIDKLQERRKEIWIYYTSELRNVVMCPIDSDGHSYFTYCIRAKNRNLLAKYLLENGVYTTLRYHPLHLNPIYNQTNVRLPNCEQLNEDALNIPLHPRLTDKEVEFVVTLIKKFYK